MLAFLQKEDWDNAATIDSTQETLFVDENGIINYAGFIEYYNWFGPPISVPFNDMFEDNGEAQSGIVQMRLLWNHEGTDFKHQGIRFSLDENGELIGVVVEPS